VRARVSQPVGGSQLGRSRAGPRPVPAHRARVSLPARLGSGYRKHMAIKVAVGMSNDLDAVAAFDDAAAQARAGLDDAPADLCLVFAGAPHLEHGEAIVAIVQDALRPRALIGCGAGGLVGGRREIEDGLGAVVWALSAPDGTFDVRHLTT